MVATMKGKAAALEALTSRRKKNADKARIDNSSLPAGSPMYYYCRTCGDVMVESEGHWGPAPKYCLECTALIDLGWMK